MIEKILHRPVTVLMAFSTLTALAIFSYTRLPIELSSEVDLPRLSVLTSWSYASAEMMERSITTLVEQTAVTVSGVKKISSTSAEGQSTVEVEFQKNTDMDLARLEMAEKMAALYRVFPEGADAPRLQRYVPKEFENLQGFITLQLFGPMSLSSLQSYAQEKIRPVLLGVKGVANVQILGGAEREIVLRLDEERLKSLNVGLTQVRNAIQNSQREAPAGVIQQQGQLHYVYIGDRLYHTDDLNRLVIPASHAGGRPIRLAEICTVQDTLAEPQSMVRINGHAAITIEIDKEPGINMLDTAAGVDETAARLALAFPSNMMMDKVSDRSKDLRDEIQELSGKSLLSALCVILILILFFRSLSLSLIVFFTVLFSTAGALIFLALSGIGLNIITLSALALSFGVLVDNAVVIFENIERQFESADSRSPLQCICEGVKEIRLPLFAATATTIGALLPVVFLPENLAAYFVQFASTSAVTLAFSYLVAFTFIPVALQWHRRKWPFRESVTGDSKNESPVLRGIKKAYEKVIRWNLHHRKTVLLLSIWFIGVPIWFLPGKWEIKPLSESSLQSLRLWHIENNVAFLYNAVWGNTVMTKARPYIDHVFGGASHLFFKYVYKGELWKFGQDTYLVVSLRAPQGTELERIDQFTRQIEARLEQDQNVIHRYITRVYSRFAQVRVEFDAATASTAAPLILKDQLTALVAGTSGFGVSVYGFGPGFFSGGSSGSTNQQIQVLGYNYNKIKEIAQQVGAVLSRNPRVADLELDRLPWQSVEYELVGRIDRPALARHGISIADFMNALAAKLRRNLTRQSMLVRNDDIRYSLGFVSHGNMNRHPDTLSELDVAALLHSPISAGGRTMTVGDALSIETRPIMSEIHRENQQYTRYVSYSFKGPYKMADRFLKAVIKSIKTPAGYEVKEPEYWLQFIDKDALPMLLIALTAILIVFMITASLYESMIKPFIILLTVPMSLAGLFLGFYFFDINFGRGGYAAVILLIGLSVNNGILLVDRMTHLTRIGGAAVDLLLYRAVLQRTRPILITTLTTIAGFLPFVIAADIYSFWYSFSFAVICGLAVSTILILSVLPALYRLFHRNP